MVQYEPAAVRLLVQMMDPDFVCTVSVPCHARWDWQTACDLSLPTPLATPCLFPHLAFFPFLMQKIRACDSPLGSEPCAWGPGYWCASMATAIECDVSGVAVPSATRRTQPASLWLHRALHAPSILPVSPRRPSSTAGVIYGTRSHLSGRARCGLGSAPKLS